MTGSRRILLAAVVMVLVPARLAGSAYAWVSHTSSGWRASAALYTVSHGRWQPATSVDSLGELRGVLTVRGKGVTGSGVTATMQIMHLSWQGFSKVVLPPAVTMRMCRTAASNGQATFVADVQIPTLLPVYWSIVRFVVSDGRTRLVVRSGVMVGGPARRTAFNTLSVPRARTFCAARPPLPYLRYAVYLHGYFVGIASGSDGPPTGFVLAGPPHGTATRLRTSGIPAGGLGLPYGRRGMARGLLACGHGKPLGFGAYP